MKKSILAIASIALMISCNKAKEAEPVNNTATDSTAVENVQTPAVKTNNQEDEQIAYLYKADNGDILEVNYLNDTTPNQIQVKMGDKTMVLDQTSDWAKGAEYKKDNDVWTSKDNNATFKVGDKTLNLVLLSPLTYQYKGDNGNVTATYYDKNGKWYVKLSIAGIESVTLEQTSAWAKGAEYGDEDIKWTSKRYSGELEKDGSKTIYKQVD